MPTGALSRQAFAIIFCVSLATAVGNTGMQSVLPAIGRSIGIPDPLVAAIFSLSAVLWAVVSPFWGRASDRLGRKPMMIVGLGGFAVSMFLCALVVSVGLQHWLAPLVVFGLFLLSRSLFGLIGSASNPATQAYVAERTTPEERTPKMSQLAGSFGLGTILGPAIAPLFVLPLIGLAGPMYAFAFAAAAMIYVVARYLPADGPGERQHVSRLWTMAREEVASIKNPAAREKGLWFDPRLFPFLLYGFLIASCQGVQGQTLGFVIIDKLGVSPLAAQGYTAVAMMAGAIAGLLAQWGLVMMFQMRPRDLLRVGVMIAAGANIIAAFAPNYWTVVIGFALANLGYGLSRPGFTAGSSLSVNMDEQARAAGAIAAVNGSSFIFAPVLSVWMYEHVAPSPFLMNVGILAWLVFYCYSNNTLKNAGDLPATSREVAASTLERTDESGPNV